MIDFYLALHIIFMLVLAVSVLSMQSAKLKTITKVYNRSS